MGTRERLKVQESWQKNQPKTNLDCVVAYLGEDMIPVLLSCENGNDSDIEGENIQ